MRLPHLRFGETILPVVADDPRSFLSHRQIGRPVVQPKRRRYWVVTRVVTIESQNRPTPQSNSLVHEQLRPLGD